MVSPERPIVRTPERADDVPNLVRSLGFDVPRPVLVLVGGARGLSDADVDHLAEHLREHVLPSIARVNAAVIDGGTDAGVMRAIGRARRESQARFPLVGVAAQGPMHPAGRPGGPGSSAVVEPNHTHLVIVPGSAWGDEVPWLGTIAAAVSGSRASVTLLVNGGEIAYNDMQDSLSHDRPVVVLAGSGRTADEVAAAAEDVGTGSSRARALAASPLTVVVPFRDGDRLHEVLDILLGPAMIAE